MQKNETTSETRRAYTPPTLSLHGDAIEHTQGCSGWGFENITFDKTGTYENVE